MRLKLKWVNHHRNWDFLPSQNEIWLLNKILSLWNDFSKLYFRRDTRVCVYLYSIQMKRILTEAIWKILAYAFFQMFLFDPHPPENIIQSKVISWVDQKAASRRNGLRKYWKIPMPWAVFFPWSCSAKLISKDSV